MGRQTSFPTRIAAIAVSALWRPTPIRDLRLDGFGRDGQRSGSAVQPCDDRLRDGGFDDSTKTPKQGVKIDLVGCRDVVGSGRKTLPFYVTFWVRNGKIFLHSRNNSAMFYRHDSTHSRRAPSSAAFCCL